MLSMPPATTYLKSTAPSRSLAAIITARMPEPQTLFKVIAPVETGQPHSARLAGRGLALTGRQHVAHEHLVDPLRRQLRPLQRRADHVRAELVGAERRQFAHEPAKRRAGGGKDDDGIGSLRPWRTLLFDQLLLYDDNHI